MKEEEDASTSTCLAKETQAFAEEFIKEYERLPVLWDVKHADYTNKYRRGAANDSLLKIMKKWDSTATRVTVRNKINILRSGYRKDLRKYLNSKTIGPDGEEIFEYTPKNWKFYALKFLGGKVEEVDGTDQNKTSSIFEVNLNDTNFEDEASEHSGSYETYNENDALQTFCEDTTYKQNEDTEIKKNKRMKYEIQKYYVEDNMLDKEFEAIGANVACKLKRMNSLQRCHAELLINKVLIGGLRNSLTDETDLTEVNKL